MSTSDLSIRSGVARTLLACGLLLAAVSACSPKTVVNVQSLEAGRYFFASVRGNGTSNQVRTLEAGRAFRIDADGNVLDPLPIFDAPEPQGAEPVRLVLIGLDNELWDASFPGFVAARKAWEGFVPGFAAAREATVRLMDGPVSIPSITALTEDNLLPLPNGTLVYEADENGKVTLSPLNPEDILKNLHLSMPWDFEWSRREGSDMVRSFVPVPLTFLDGQDVRDVTQVRWLDNERVVAFYNGFLVLLTEGESPCGDAPSCACAAPWCIDLLQNQTEGSAPWSIVNKGQGIADADKRFGEFALYRDASRTPVSTHVVVARWFEPYVTVSEPDPECLNKCAILEPEAVRDECEKECAKREPEGVLDFFEVEEGGFRRLKRVCVPDRLFSVDVSEDGLIAVTTNPEKNPPRDDSKRKGDRPPKGVSVWHSDAWAFDADSSTTCASLPPVVEEDLSERELGPIRWTGRNDQELVTGSPTEMLYFSYGVTTSSVPELTELQRYAIRDRFGDGGRSPQAFAIRSIAQGGDFELWASANDNAVYRQDLSGSIGTRLGRRGEVETVPIPLDPPLLPRLSACGPSVNLQAMGVSSEYAYFGGFNCKYLFQMRLEDRAFSLVDPDPALPTTDANRDNGIRSLDVRNDRVVFGGIGFRLYVFP